MKTLILILGFLTAQFAQAETLICAVTGYTADASFLKSGINVTANEAPIYLDRVKLYAHIEIQTDSATFYLTKGENDPIREATGAVTGKISPLQKTFLIAGRVGDQGLTLSCARLSEEI